MDIDERAFFQTDVTDDWLLTRVSQLRVQCPCAELSWTGTSVPLARVYAWYLAVAAQRAQLAERIYRTSFREYDVEPLEQDGILVFRAGTEELHLSANCLFKYCSLSELHHWLPAMLSEMASPRHLPAFTTDIVSAVTDEALLALLFTRIPLLYLPTAPAAAAAPPLLAQRVAAQHQRLLVTSSHPAQSCPQRTT